MASLASMLEVGNNLTMSKGSKQRPRVVTQKQFEDSWDKIFPRKKTPPQGRTQVHKNKKKPSRVDLKRELRDNIDYGND